jgi:hypothetical protein
MSSALFDSFYAPARFSAYSRRGATDAGHTSSCNMHVLCRVVRVMEGAFVLRRSAAFPWHLFE